MGLQVVPLVGGLWRLLGLDGGGEEELAAVVEAVVGVVELPLLCRDDDEEHDDQGQGDGECEEPAGLGAYLLAVEDLLLREQIDGAGVFVGVVDILCVLHGVELVAVVELLHQVGILHAAGRGSRGIALRVVGLCEEMHRLGQKLVVIGAAGPLLVFLEQQDGGVEAMGVHIELGEAGIGVVHK